jgi:acyl-coenzyme A thioesterase PaaI-like protein
MRLGEEHANPQGSMHGGFAALLVDKVTTLALQSNNNGVPGVSVDMTMS